MAVKTFASKRAGPLALLKVFTSFFPEKQKEKNQGGGRIEGPDEPLASSILPPRPELGQPHVTGMDTDFQVG